MKNRFHAFLTHLLLSGLVALIAVIIVFFVWYPAPLHTAVGVTHIFLILLSVDIAIGPVLTFIVYKKGKPSLKFDLSVIVALQITALSYGMYTVFEGRPAFVVFSIDRFDVSRAYEIDPDSAKTAQLSGNKSAITGWFGPNWVGAMRSTNHKRRQEIMFSSVAGGPDWHLLPELFVPLEQVKDQILKTAKPLQELRLLHNKDNSIDALLDWNAVNVKWQPLRSNAKNMVVLIDADSAKVIRVVDINPWP